MTSVLASGTARIRHLESDEIFEIDSDDLEFEVSGSDERQMGAEIQYSASIQHPVLGDLTWSIWEYPLGAENHQQTDVGLNELIEDIHYELSFDPDDEEGQFDSRVDELVEWFFENYEDPVHRLPYVSAEGGYQWVFGGPYDAKEELFDNFPNENEDIIDAAVERIEEDGITDWSPTPKAEDYDDYSEDPEIGNESESVLEELESLIENSENVPIESDFILGDDGIIYLSLPTNEEGFEPANELLEELRVSNQDLQQSLNGTNAYTILLDAVTRYTEALHGERISIPRLYARGVRLDNAKQTTENHIRADNLPPLPQIIEQALRSTLELHRAYIMSFDQGRDLAQGADAYNRSTEQNTVLKEAAERIVLAIEETPTLFAGEVREHFSEIVEEIGQGPQPNRSNQVAIGAFKSLFSSMLSLKGWMGATAAGAVLGNAFSKSIPGTLAEPILTNTINSITAFLIKYADLIKALFIT